jgi:Protein of unknown function (DUF433)
MASLDWSQCPAVESVPGKMSGAWVFQHTRMPVATVFENLEAGMSLKEITDASGGDQGRSSVCRREPGNGAHLWLMKVLCDNGVPNSMAVCLRGHQVTFARKVGWHELGNGDLIQRAELAGYEVLPTRTFDTNRS